jgi:hypothetical protein
MTTTMIAFIVGGMAGAAVAVLIMTVVSMARDIDEDPQDHGGEPPAQPRGMP